jgi:glucokinase
MYYIGIDIGGMSIKAGLTDEKGNILAKESIVTKPDNPYAETVKDIAALCEKLLASAGIDKSQLKAVGMGIPGTINSKKGIITYSNNIRFENVPIVKEFQKYLDVPTFIGNDANCAALGEVVFGMGKGYKDAIFITLGTGVGSGIILDGKIFEGKDGAGAEAGHIGIRIGGIRCTCGKKGCWESYASASALVKQTKKAMDRHPESLMHKIAEEDGKISGRTAFKAARAGDKAGLYVVNRYVKYVSEGLLSLVNLFRPEILLIGGGVSNEGDYFIKKLQAQVTRYSYGGKRNPYVKVLKASLLNDAGILGAVALCL